jgi:uncharacterized membrane protein YeaQ/YmgE (transglycosylase-associated protein family)
MTGELLLASVAVGLLGGWLTGIVMGPGRYGLLGDLSLGLIGGCLAVWAYQAIGLAAHTGTVGGMVAAFLGAVGALLAQHTLRHLAAERPS